MIHRDFPDVLAIEDESFDDPWTKEEMVKTLRVRNHIGMVAEINCKIVGFMIYELSRNKLDILDFAVDISHRGIGVGTAMCERLKSKLSTDRRSSIFTHVSDGNLAAHLFFQKCGFRAVGVVRDYYSSSDNDCYVFKYSV